MKKFKDKIPKEKALFLIKKQRRLCYTMHECCLCNQKIIWNDIYYDGGYGKRAHDYCVKEISK